MFIQRNPIRPPPPMHYGPVKQPMHERVKYSCLLEDLCLVLGGTFEKVRRGTVLNIQASLTKLSNYTVYSKQGILGVTTASAGAPFYHSGSPWETIESISRHTFRHFCPPSAKYQYYILVEVTLYPFLIHTIIIQSQ